jgi:hypothetical protein
MKPLHRHLIAATLLAAAGVAAVAQTTPPPAGNPPAREYRHDPARAEQMRARMQERMAKRLGELKQKLAISSAQEGAWSAWTTALQPAPRQRADRAEFAALTTPERIDRMRAVRAERNAAMDKRMDATKNFYAALNAEQKKTFDAESLRFLAGGKRGHGHRHGQHHRG